MQLAKWLPNKHGYIAVQHALEFVALFQKIKQYSTENGDLKLKVKDQLSSYDIEICQPSSLEAGTCYPTRTTDTKVPLVVAN